MMDHYQGKGKGIDRSTPWSDLAWDAKGGYWYCSRMDPTGVEEYHRYPASESVPSSPKAQDPTGSNVASQSPMYSTPIKTSNTAYTASQTGDYVDNDSDATPTPGIAATIRKIYSISLTGPCTLPQEAFNSQVTETLKNKGKDHISKFSKEPQDDDYKVCGGLREDEFWQVGRVFMTFWSEQAQSGVPGQRGTHSDSRFDIINPGQKASGENRGFVVVSEGHGSSICCPIERHSNKATPKPELHAPQRNTIIHQEILKPDLAIIHTTSKCPGVCKYQTHSGNWLSEKPVKDPIRVITEQKDGSHLDAVSRLNYSKRYTMEHSVKVFNVGMVAKDSMNSLLRDSGFSNTNRPASEQRPRPNLPSKPSSHQKPHEPLPDQIRRALSDTWPATHSKDTPYEIKYSINWEVPEYEKWFIHESRTIKDLLTLTSDSTESIALQVQHYLSKTWPDVADLIMKAIDTYLVSNSEARGFKHQSSELTLILCPSSRVDSNNEHGEFIMMSAFARHGIHENLIFAMSWLCSALRIRPQSTLSQSSVLVKTSDTDNDSFDIALILNDLLPFPKSGEQSHCWHTLFPRMVVAQGFEVKPRYRGRGLEISLGDMQSVTECRHWVTLDSGLLLVGRWEHPVIVPVENLPKDNAIQWRYFKKDEYFIGSRSESRTWDSVNNLKDWYKVSDMAVLEKKRCFLE
ncbi:hypothetical protein NHQ30_011254 [Ciborinia camelliae]|nr:hypothetical protein NHQ30_011254 [Ciborinia camelliae]